LGLVDGRPAVLVYDRNDPSGLPAHFVLLEWTGEKLIHIRDFLFAPYAIKSAEVITLA